MYSSIQIHDLRGAIHGFVCSRDRADWRAFLATLDNDDGERLERTLGAAGHPRIAVVASIAVHEDFHGRNIGRTLLHQFLHVAQADAIIVAATRPARNFFKAMGFAACGESGLMVLEPGQAEQAERLAA